MSDYFRTQTHVRLEDVHTLRDRLIGVCADPDLDLSDEVARDRIDVAAKDLCIAYEAYIRTLRAEQEVDR